MSVRKFAWFVLGVFTICLGISAVWAVDIFFVEHGLLGDKSPAPVPPSSVGHAPHVPMTLTNKILNVVFLLVLLTILVFFGYLIAKRRTARDAARLPGEVDEFGILGPFRRRRQGDRTIDSASVRPPVELPEPADPRQLPSEVALLAQPDATRRNGDGPSAF
jgi:hypothetical protein